MSYYIDGKDVKVVVASADLIVHDDTLGIDRQIVAGQPVPPELLAGYKKATAAAKAPAAAAKAKTAPDTAKLRTGPAHSK